MHVSFLVTALAASLAFASPLPPQTGYSSPDGIRHSVGLRVITSAPGQPKESTTISAELNHLTPVPVYPVYEIQFIIGGINQNVDEDKVECRAYKDASAQQPGSAPFNVKNSALISTTGVSEAVVLCYRVTDGEAVEF